jgi:translation initiation factor eIF-2B subunit delta
MQPPLAFDSVSPQTPLLDEGARWLAERVREGQGDTAAVVAAGRALCDAQPAMAALIALATRAILVARKADDEAAPPAERVARVEAAIETWRADFALAGEAIVTGSVETLPPSGWVATLTRSSLVERSLLAAHAAGRDLHVLCAESRPMNEGRALAGALAAAGVPAWLAVDGTLGLLLPQAGAVWLGADCVREQTFVGKAGTYGLLLIARELNLPAYVFAQRAKFLPDRCRRLTLPRRDPAEVWPDAPRGVHVVNVPFEEAPLSLVRGVLTEGGFLGPREVTDAAGVTPVATELLDGAPLASNSA